MSKRFDAIVIGGGLAGAACAKFATDKNLSVLLLERSQGPGMKVCSEGCPCSVSEIMDLAPFVVNKIRGGRVFVDDELIQEIPRSKTVGYIIDRQGLCNWFCKELIEKGSRAQFQTKIVSVSKNIVTTAKGETFEGRYIVFADGTNTIARHAFDFDEYETSMALQYLVSGCDLERHDFVSLHLFSKDLGFGWVFPLSARLAHVGASCERASKVKQLVDGLLSMPGVKGGRIQSLRGARMFSSGILPSIVNEKLGYLVCGDAVG